MKIMLSEGAYMPVRAYENDAGLDLRSMSREVVYAGSSAIIDTGVHVGIPVGYQGEVKGRSGLNFNHDLVVPTGTIDCGYTGSIRVKIYNLGKNHAIIEKGDKIAQLVISRIEIPKLELVDSLEKTDRGDNGFASTGR